MLSYEQILELMDKFEDSTLSELNISSETDFNLTLKREKEVVTTAPLLQASPAVASLPVQANNESSPTETPQKNTQDLIEIKSPMVGTFYSAPSPDAAAFASIGQSIKVGDTICILEAMKVMNELPSEISGTIEEICATNGQTVEFGQVLFRVKA